MSKLHGLKWPSIPAPEMGLYILDGHKPVPTDDFGVMLKWKHDHPNDWRVAQEQVGELMVSTVFLGMDQSAGLGKHRQVFETMSFDKNGRPAGLCWRYATWDEAVAGHAKAVIEAKVMNARKEIEGGS